MLQSIREKTQGVIIWGIIALIIIAFTLIGNSYSARFFGNSAVAAKVDGKKVTWKEVDSLMERQRQYLAESNPQALNQLDVKKLRAYIQQYLVHQIALDSQTKKQGFVISEKQVIKRIDSDPAFHEQGKFSVEKYKQFLQKIAEPEQMFVENVRSGMIIDQLRNGFAASSFILDNEINKMMALFFQQRDFGYLLVPASRFRSEMTINDDDVAQYFQQHQHMFIAPEQVKLAYVELTVEALAASISVTEENLQEYYQKHEALYTVPEEIELCHILINAPRDSDLAKGGEARAKINDILARAKLGEDFNKLAKQYSEDPISAADGGKLGKIGRGQTVAEFEDAAFTLSKDGELSEVVQTEYGYHIIKLLKKHESYVKPYAVIHEQLVENYRREAAESQFADKGEELANLAFEYPDSLQYAAEKMQLPIKETELFTKDQGEGIAKVPQVIATAFNAEMVGKTKNSDLLKIDDERYVVIRVKEHVPARPLALAEVREQIEDSLIKQATKKKAEDLGNVLLAKLQGGSMPFTIAKEANLEWLAEKDVERTNAKINQYIVQKAFALPIPNAQKTINVGFSLPSGDYAVLSLQTVKTSAKADEEHIKEQFKQQVAMLLAQTEFQLYEQALVKNAKIKMEPFSY